MKTHSNKLLSKFNRAVAVSVASVLLITSNMSMAGAVNEITGSWVDTKDDWRYGIDGTPQEVNKNYALGNATGDFAIKLCDGSWYWYHQTNGGDGCDYCGDWSAAKWGSSINMGHTIGNDGCGVYSMSIIVSNLVGQPIDPITWLVDCGCEVKLNSNNVRVGVKTDKSKCFSGRMLNAYETVLGVAKEKYGLSYTENLIGLSKDEQKKKVDEVLDRGGMIWIRTKCGSSSSTNWPYYTTSSHYIPIRSRDDKGYYILDECQNIFDRANKPVSWDTIYSNEHSDCLFGIWNENMSNISTGNNSNKNKGTSWYTPASTLVDSKKKTKKKTIGLTSYKLYYDGLPWDTNSKTYMADTDAMLYSLFEYVGETSEGISAQSSWGEVTAKNVISNNTRMIANNDEDIENSANWKDYKKGLTGDRYYEIDGIKCVAVSLPLAVLDKDYCDTFNGYNTSQNINYWAKVNDTKYNYGKAKLALVLKEKSTGKVCYLPATLCNANEYSFPGGVTNTGLSVKSDWTLDSSGQPTEGSLSYVNGKNSTGTWNGKISELASFMNKKEFGTDDKGTAWDYVANVAEIWCANTSLDKSVISGGDYKLVGVVVWADTIEAK